jgi:hypothetical protein
MKHSRQRQLRHKFHHHVMSPRSVTTSNFPVLDPRTNIEEEKMLAYSKGPFYPVKIGHVFSSKYQALNKLGFGANSTVWFCRDLQ